MRLVSEGNYYTYMYMHMYACSCMTHTMCRVYTCTVFMYVKSRHICRCCSFESCLRQLIFFFVKKELPLGTHVVALHCLHDQVFMYSTGSSKNLSVSCLSNTCVSSLSTNPTETPPTSSPSNHDNSNKDKNGGGGSRGSSRSSSSSTILALLITVVVFIVAATILGFVFYKKERRYAYGQPLTSFLHQ